MDVEALKYLKRHFTDDIAMLPGRRVVCGPDNIIAFHEYLYTRVDSFNLRFIIDSIHVLGGLAVEKGRTRGMVYPKDRPERMLVNYLYTYERDHSGARKITRMSW